MTQTIEEFSWKGSEVTLYVCGITPYDTTHVGHAFTYTAYDQLIRYLEMKGTSVRYAQNVTDIDDDILKKAKETGEDWRQLGNCWTDHYIDDMIALNVRPPDYFPHATDVIAGIIHAVEDLIRAGVAYVKNGSVLRVIGNGVRAFSNRGFVMDHALASLGECERCNHKDSFDELNSEFGPVEFRVPEINIREVPYLRSTVRSRVSGL